MFQTWLAKTQEHKNKRPAFQDNDPLYFKACKTKTFYRHPSENRLTTLCTTWPRKAEARQRHPNKFCRKHRTFLIQFRYSFARSLVTNIQHLPPPWARTGFRFPKKLTTPYHFWWCSSPARGKKRQAQPKKHSSSYPLLAIIGISTAHTPNLAP